MAGVFFFFFQSYNQYPTSHSLSHVFRSEDGLHWAALLGYVGERNEWLANMQVIDQLLLKAQQELHFPKLDHPPVAVFMTRFLLGVAMAKGSSIL